MNARSLSGILLLLFAAGSTALVLLHNAMPSSAPHERPSSAVIAYYFHGDKRCPDCRKIESLAREAIHSGFPDALKSGRLQWRVVNWESPANRYFQQAYGLAFATVVLVRYHDHREVEFKKLSGVWQLLSDRDEFVRMVQAETRRILEAAP